MRFLSGRTQGLQRSLKQQRWSYFLRSLCGRFDRRRMRCPHCSCSRHTTVKRKCAVTALVRCESCRLLFRVPTDPPGFGDRFYQEQYDGDFVTDLPSETELRDLLSRNFADSATDMREEVSILRALGINAGARILDYGASWGYGVYQYQQAGYEAVGFEISRARAAFARDVLGVNVTSDRKDLYGPFDVLLLNHVLEHLPSPQIAFSLADALLGPDGLFVAFTPNGCIQRCGKDQRAYHRVWGSVHPLYLDDEFYQSALAGRPKLICSTPLDVTEIGAWNQCDNLTWDLEGWELLCVCAWSPPSDSHTG